MAKAHKFGQGQKKLRGITLYDDNIQVPIGQFDIVANTRSFGAWGNQLTDGDLITPYVQGSQNTPYWPSEHVVCLNGLFAIDRIEIWDKGGGANFIIKSGLNFHGGHTVDQNITLNQNVKRTFSFAGKQVRFISLTVNQTKAEVQANSNLRNGPAEIRIFGKAISFDAVRPKVDRPSRSFKQMLGWNQDIFTDIIANVYINTRHPLPGTHMRVYDSPSKWMSTAPWPNTKFSFSDGYEQGVDYDNYFQQSKNLGIKIIPTMIGLASPQELFKPSYDTAGLPYTPFIQPRQATASSTDPNSYFYGALFSFQWALRYGYLATNTSLALCDPIREAHVRVGTGLCNQLEMGNELDNWFRAENEGYLPAELAAFVSACVDGHCGTMGAGLGALNADAGFEMICPAMADYSIDFYMAMFYWFVENRADHQPPQFSLNFHGYNNTGGGQFVYGAKMMAPETFARVGVNTDGGVRKYADVLFDKMKRFYPNRPIYITEFGCDSNKYSPVGPALPTQAQAALQAHPLNSWQQQAVWVVWTTIEWMMGNSVDYATQFTLNDYGSTNEKVERFSDVDDNSDTVGWNAGGYGVDIQFATSGDQAGPYAFQLASSSSPINVATATVGQTIVLTLPDESLRPDYTWPSVIQMRDPADSAGNGAHLYCSYVSKTATTLTVQVANVGPGGVSFSGTGSFSIWRLDTPFSRKLKHYMNRNFLDILGPGVQLRIRDDSTSEYLHYVFGDSARETHLLKLPGQVGNQMTRTVNFGRSTTCMYRNPEDKTYTSAPFTLTGTSASVVINEVPKIFYFDL